MSSQWYLRRWVGVTLHVLFWALFFISPFLLRPVWNNGKSFDLSRNLQGFIYLHLLNNALRMGLFYANAYFFIPRLLYRKKHGAYLVAIVVSLLVLLLGDWIFFNSFIHGMKYSVWNFFVFNLFPFIFIIVVSAAYRIIQDQIRKNQQAQERETENLKTELSFLRSQVSPHFMFNVLNNMVAMARKKSDILEPSLIKLSSLLRYMLYETDEQRVPLEKEVDYLRSYIDLQQQRFGRIVAISTRLEGIEAGHSIEPMLLIPFVENAFKHGTGLVEDAVIEVELKTEKGLLTFNVRNKFNPGTSEIKDPA
ncbi:MAG TPA: histidine kinase, partial [Chitinophagaceae bacterium]|nr:histidine kinase [Chitinophagaceae bacterium]